MVFETTEKLFIMVVGWVVDPSSPPGLLWLCLAHISVMVLRAHATGSNVPSRCAAILYSSPSFGRKNPAFEISSTERHRRRSLSATHDDTPSTHQDFPTQRAKLRGKLPIQSRTVPLGICFDENDSVGGERSGGLSATVWEVEHPSEMMEMWWSAGAADKEKIGDPFGVVMWPGSLVASQEMDRHRSEIEGATVLVLGCGTGLEAQAAAMLGAKRVIATDVNKLSLKLLDFGAKKAGLDKIIESKVFDLFSEHKLPKCDVVIAADILYNEMLGAQMGLRCTELLGQDVPPKIIITDSQRFAGTDFLPFVNTVMEKWGRPSLSWEETVVESFTGSGMLIEGDQTYDVTVRMISTGWGNGS